MIPTYDRLDAPRELKSSPVSPTLLTQLELLPGSGLPWYLYNCVYLYIFVNLYICIFEFPNDLMFPISAVGIQPSPTRTLWPSRRENWFKMWKLVLLFNHCWGYLVQDVVHRLHLPHPDVVQPGGGFWFRKKKEKLHLRSAAAVRRSLSRWSLVWDITWPSL